MKKQPQSLKTSAIILILTILFSAFSTPSFANVVPSIKIIHVSTVGDLMCIANNPNDFYTLTNDIDASNANINIQTFSGSLNGQGYQIKLGSKPLFGKLESTANIQNLSVVSSGVNGTEENPTGLLAEVSYGRVSQCEARGSVSGSSSVGCLIGHVFGGTVSDCFSSGSVYAHGSTVGGLIGKAENSTIERCYSTAAVSGGSLEVGALIGDNSGSTIANCYASSTESGQMLGVGLGSDTVSNKAADELKSAQTFPDFDFDNIWTIIEGETTPLLVSINGKGTEQKPYRLHCMMNPQTNLDILKAGLGENGKNKYFRLDSDITNHDILPSYGNDKESFNGVFDGDNHVVYNWDESRNGIFGSIGESGLVKNINIQGIKASYLSICGPIANINYGTVKNCHVSNASIGGMSTTKDLGGIVGENINGTIRRCSFSGDISAGSTGMGGIVGYNSYGTITECSVKNGEIYGGSHSTGGIVGDNTCGIVENCINYGLTVHGKSEVGGIAGRLYNGTVRNCYANQQTTPQDTCGGVVGAIIENGTVENCYYNSEKTSIGIGSTNDTTGALNYDTVKSLASFEDFDFSNTWTTDENGDIALLAIEGAGTKENPYIIRNVSDWADAGDGINNNGDKNYYILSNNIYDMHSNSYSKSEFSGSLNGRGYTVNLSRSPFITNLNQGGYIGNIEIISSDRGCDAISNCDRAKVQYVLYNCYKNNGGNLFGEIKDSTVRNCAVISSGNSYSESICGGFVNSVSGSSLIDNCYVRSSNLTGSNFAGGFVGNNSGGKITNCYVYNSTVSSQNSAGGFAGRNDNGGIIQNCYTNAVVTSDTYPGAFIGTNYAMISNSYANNEGGLEFAAQNDGSTDNVTLSSEGTDMPNVYIATSNKAIDVKDPTVYTPATTPVQSGLTDIAGHWAESTIKNLVNLGIVNGYEDNTYRPENSVTKGEYIKLLMNATKNEKSFNFTQYRDVNASWAKGFISHAIELGICDNINSEDTIFGVDTAITRAEAASLMGRLLASDKIGTPDFTDTSAIPDWAINPIFASVELGLITGNDDGSFRPLNNLTRAEAATIIERILSL